LKEPTSEVIKERYLTLRSPEEGDQDNWISSLMAVSWAVVMVRKMVGQIFPESRLLRIDLYQEIVLTAVLAKSSVN
jgi:hypothetical protein